MKEIYLIIFQGGDKNVLNVVRTQEKFIQLYSKASRYNYDDRDEAIEIAIRLAKENSLRYIGDGQENSPQPTKKYLD